MNYEKTLLRDKERQGYILRELFFLTNYTTDSFFNGIPLDDLVRSLSRQVTLLKGGPLGVGDSSEQHTVIYECVFSEKQFVDSIDNFCLFSCEVPYVLSDFFDMEIYLCRTAGTKDVALRLKVSRNERQLDAKEGEPFETSYLFSEAATQVLLQHLWGVCAQSENIIRNNDDLISEIDCVMTTNGDISTNILLRTVEEQQNLERTEYGRKIDGFVETLRLAREKKCKTYKT